MVKSELYNRQLNKRTPVEEADAVAVLEDLAKQCEESIQEFRRANRLDLAQRGLAEIAILERYLERVRGRLHG